MKNNIEFYQHYSTADQHPKFKMLRVGYGWAGEGRFWALNNRIAQSENCKLDISKKYNRAATASDLGMNIQEFTDYIKYLVEECELVREVAEGIITTDIVQENFNQVMTNRAKARERKQKNLKNLLKGSPEPLKGSPEQNKKVKESKVKETKEKKVKKENSPIVPPLKKYLKNKIIENHLENHQDKILEFFDYRMAMPKKDRYRTEKGLNGLVRDLKGCLSRGMNIDQCIDIAMERDWKTPNPEYYKQQPGRVQRMPARSQRNAEACVNFIEKMKRG